MVAVDVALLGGGGAGTTVLHALALAADRGGPREQPLRVAVVDPLDRLVERPADRTWCSWLRAGSASADELAPAVHRWWPSVHLVDGDGADHRLDLGGLRYAMVRSEDYYGVVARAVHTAVARDRLRLVHHPVLAGEVEDGRRRACVHTPAGRLEAAWVLDSRPAPPVRAASTSLVQVFRGQRVRAPHPVADPGRAVLMDLSLPQPPVGLAFGYCLPSDERTALVEHTLFVPAAPPAAAHAEELAAYRVRALGTADGVVEHAEDGAIPMTDAVHARRAGHRVLRLGTAGGAVRPSTGYAFAAMRRAAAVLAAQLLAGAPLQPPRPYPRRHAWMDALVLRALAGAGADRATGARGLLGAGVDGPGFFTRLFAENPPERVLRFLDGLSTPREELALMTTAPRRAMLAAAAADAAWRTGRLLRAPTR